MKFLANVSKEAVSRRIVDNGMRIFLYFDIECTLLVKFPLIRIKNLQICFLFFLSFSCLHCLWVSLENRRPGKIFPSRKDSDGYHGNLGLGAQVATTVANEGQGVGNCCEMVAITPLLNLRH